MVQPQLDDDFFPGFSQEEIDIHMENGDFSLDDFDIESLNISPNGDLFDPAALLGDGSIGGHNGQNSAAGAPTAVAPYAANLQNSDHVMVNTSAALAGLHAQATPLGAAPHTTTAPGPNPPAPQQFHATNFTSMLNSAIANANNGQHLPSQPPSQPPRHNPPPPPPPAGRRRAPQRNVPAPVKHLRPLARALAAMIDELKQHIPDPARIKLDEINALLDHLLGGPNTPNTPNPLPYPEAADFEGPHNPKHEPQFYLARLFSELLGRPISAEDMKECVSYSSGRPWLVSEKHLLHHRIYTASYQLPLTRDACRAAQPPADNDDDQRGNDNDDNVDQSGTVPGSGSSRPVRRAAAGRGRGKGSKSAARGRKAGGQQAAQPAAPADVQLQAAQQRMVYMIVPMAAAPTAPAAGWPAAGPATAPAPAPAAAAAVPAPTSSATSSGSKRSRGQQLSDECTSETSSGQEEQQEQEQVEDDAGCCSKKQRTSCQQVKIKQEKKTSKALAAADAAADAALGSSANIRPLSTSQQDMAASVAELVRCMLSADPLAAAADYKLCLQHFSSGLLPGLSRDHLAGVIEVMSACLTLSLQEGQVREARRGL